MFKTFLVAVDLEPDTHIDYLLGTTAARVVRHAACSVFVARLDGATNG